MAVLVYDVETTGFPSRRGFDQYFDFHETPRYEGSRVVQLCALLFDDEGRLSDEFTAVVRPQGFTIENSHIHGVTTEAALLTGKPFPEVAGAFGALLGKAKLLVAHNASFDRHVLAAELFRGGFVRLAEELFTKPHFCTMREGTGLCRLAGRHGCYKSPRLEELHRHLFGTGFPHPHTAHADASATARCFFEMRPC